MEFSSVLIPNSDSPNWGVKRIRYTKEESDRTEEKSYMDERIWGRFPEDLMVRVVSYLPISLILRSTILCKSWNSIISSSFFHKLNSEIPPNLHNPWFLMFLREFADFCVAYDPYLNKWIEFSFKFLLSPFRPIAAGDGLVCLLFKTPSGFSLSICNPISKSQHNIPTPMSVFRYFFIVSGLFSDRVTGFFRLVLAGSEPISIGSGQFVLLAEVYDSEVKMWTRARSFPVNSPISPWRAISNGVLYCVLGHFPMSIVAFNIRHRVWFMLEAQLPHSLTIIRLMDHKNRLVMIGGVGTKGITEEIGIWQLDGREWKKIGWIPKDICDFFLRSPTRQFSCIGLGDLIYFTSKRCSFVVMYVISRNCMKLLDPSPRLLDPHYHVSCGFCFEPRL